MSAAHARDDPTRFDGAVIGGRPTPPSDLGDGAAAMALAVSTPCQKLPTRESCDVLLLISSAFGYERRRAAQRATYLAAMKADPALAPRVRYRFLLGAPKPEQAEALEAEQAEHGDLLQVAVPESYETLFPKIVAAWRWAVATHDFGYWMHADDDSYLRLDLLLPWLSKGGADAGTPAPSRSLYAGYIWDGSEGRRTKPLRDPEAKSYMPVEQWPHDSYPSFASGCGFLIASPLVEALVERSASMTFFRVIDVPVGIYLDMIEKERPGSLTIVHMPEVRPYRPLPLFRADTICQHYMQPEEFKQFHQRALASIAPPAETAAETAADAESEARIAAVYDLFVGAKVMRR